MNKEDYVSLEVAKMLKEKGFGEPCNKWYGRNGSIFNDAHKSNHNNSIPNDSRISMPSLYEAQKWMRESHNIDVLPIIREESLPKKDYCCYIYKNAKVVSCKVAYGEDFYECMNDSLLEALKLI